MLSDGAKTELLSLARQTLESYIMGRGVPEYTPISRELSVRQGAFVSLHAGEILRGCIGQLGADEELYRVVQGCVVSAATSDTRFAPVTQAEILTLQIEISVLGPMQEVKSVEDIMVGSHGLLVSRGGKRGILLPQVATEYGWDRYQFLAQTCRKAGLPAEAWRDSATSICIFEAQVFSEQEQFLSSDDQVP